MNVQMMLKLKEGVEPPAFATSGSAAQDIRVNIEKSEELVIMPNETIIVPTGIYLSMPKLSALFILPRSGRAYKGLRVANAPGLIDSDYTDEIGVLAWNVTDDTIVLKSNDSIAQMMYVQGLQPQVEYVTKLEETDRKGGFGHTDNTGLHEKQDPLAR